MLAAEVFRAFIGGNETLMRRAVLNLTIVVGIFVVVAACVLLGRAWRKHERDKAYAGLKALPPVARDFITPEGAILCLEEAFRRRDIEAAVATKDFKTEARRMLEGTDFKAFIDDGMIAKTAEGLEASFRAYTTASWPDFEGVESYFTEREAKAEKVVLITEMCRYPDGRFTWQQVLAAETPQGWRVLNVVNSSS